MAKFADVFLAEVSKYALSSERMRDKQGELSPQLFQKKLYQLRKNVQASANLTSILFSHGYEGLPRKETKSALEQDRLCQMKKALVKIAQVPSGREVLSHMPLDIYMYALTQEDRGFFSASEKMLSVSSRHPTLWVGKQEYLKTFVHEMVHARHNQAFLSERYGFSPKAFFMESIFDELGARISAEKVYDELCSQGHIKGQGKYKADSASRIINNMEKSGYFMQFAQEIADYVGRDMTIILDEDDSLNKPLGEVFSYYMNLYPALRQKNVLNKIDAQYRKLVLYPAGQNVGLNKYAVNRRFKEFGYGK